LTFTSLWSSSTSQNRRFPGTPVGPSSTVGYAIVVNALKCLVAAELTRRGQPPLVLTSGVLIGSQASAELFDRTYDDYRSRVAQVYGPLPNDKVSG